MSPLAVASFQPLGEEELPLHLAPGAKTGLLGVQEVDPGCYQAKIRKKIGCGFISLPGCNSKLLAAWFFATRPSRRVRMANWRDFQLQGLQKEVRSCMSVP